MKPLFSTEVKSHRVLNLIEKDSIIDEFEKIPKILLKILLVLSKN